MYGHLEMEEDTEIIVTVTAIQVAFIQFQLVPHLSINNLLGMQKNALQLWLLLIQVELMLIKKLSPPTYTTNAQTDIPVHRLLRP